MRIVKVICLIFFIVQSTGVKSQVNPPYDAPDQVTWHEKTKTWFVSNLGGGLTFTRDHYGWITRINAKGKIIDSTWVTGLDAPTGMVATENKLFVCDRSGIVQIDIKSAKIEHTYPIPGAEFINDIGVSANGDLYVSDFYGNKIYRLPAGNREAEKFVDIPNSPDGLYVDGDELIVLTWGKISNRKTFETSEKGNVMIVNLKTKAVKPFFKNIAEIGNLEGITKAGEYYYITDWMAGKLLRISKKSGIEVIMTGLIHPADIDYSNSLKTLGFSQHQSSQVMFLKTGL